MAESPYALQRAAPSLQNCPFTSGDQDPHLIRGALGPLKSTTQMILQSIDSAILAGLTIVTDQPTDRPRYLVCNNRLHLRTLVLQCGLKTEYMRLADLLVLQMEQDSIKCFNITNWMANNRFHHTF